MTQETYTDARLIETMRAIEAAGSMSAAAQQLDIPLRTLENMKRAFKARKLNVPAQRDPLEASRIEVRRLKGELANIYKHNESADAIRKEIYGLSGYEPDVPSWVIAPAKKSSVARAGVPFAHWSDWHYGEVITLDATGGANEFNREIARQRVRRLVASTIRLAEGFAFHEDKNPLPGIVVALNGDLISGDIHEELAETNDMVPLVACQEVFDLLVWALDTLVERFGRVFVPCTVGNHGRTTKKPRAKDRVFLSYEWNLYMNLKRHYRDDPRITVEVPNGADAIYKVAGLTFLQTHGDALGVKGGDGIIGALGPIARGAVKLRNSEYKIGRDFDYLIMGHWHQELWIGRTVVNNALKGYDEYARLYLRAEPSRPSQGLWFVHPDRGITARISVQVGEDVKRNDKKLKWAEVSAA